MGLFKILKVIKLMSKRKEHEEFVEEMININPNIDFLSKYISAKKTITCKCKIDGYIWDSIPNRLLQGYGCPMCAGNARLTQESFLENLKVKNDKYNDFEVLDVLVNSNTKIRCLCKKDGYIWYTTPKDLLGNHGCPVCANRITIYGINDITTTHPHIIKFFKDCEKAKKYNAHSHKSEIFKCPHCGYEKECVIRNVIRCGFCCDICDSRVSYPNRLSRALLLKLPVKNLLFEYSPPWSNRKIYDNYFEYKGDKYILEMDGWWHYNDDWRTNNYSRTKEQSYKIDREKDKLALENGIKIIRIDCQKSNLEYIKNNILSSELSSIFDLSQINFEEIDIDAITNSSLLNQIYYYHDNVSHNTKEIAKHFNKSICTIYKYLKKGRLANKCLDFRKENYINSVCKNAKKISAFDKNGKFISSFDSATKCAEELTKIYNVKYYSSSITSCCTGKLKTHRGCIFQYK